MMDPMRLSGTRDASRRTHLPSIALDSLPLVTRGGTPESRYANQFPKRILRMDSMTEQILFSLEQQKCPISSASQGRLTGMPDIPQPSYTNRTCTRNAAVRGSSSSEGQFLPEVKLPRSTPCRRNSVLPRQTTPSDIAESCPIDFVVNIPAEATLPPVDVVQNNLVPSLPLNLNGNRQNTDSNTCSHGSNTISHSLRATDPFAVPNFPYDLEMHNSATQMYPNRTGNRDYGAQQRKSPPSPEFYFPIQPPPQRRSRSYLADANNMTASIGIPPYSVESTLWNNETNASANSSLTWHSDAFQFNNAEREYLICPREAPWIELMAPAIPYIPEGVPERRRSQPEMQHFHSVDSYTHQGEFSSLLLDGYIADTSSSLRRGEGRRYVNTAEDGLINYLFSDIHPWLLELDATDLRRNNFLTVPPSSHEVSTLRSSQRIRRVPSPSNDLMPYDIPEPFDRGISPSLITRLPTEYFKHDNKKEAEQLICSICKMEYDEDDCLRRLPCWHAFHCECIDRWLQTKKTCPLCRIQVDTNIQ